jgi:hypothetical protein
MKTNHREKSNESMTNFAYFEKHLEGGEAEAGIYVCLLGF